MTFPMGSQFVCCFWPVRALSTEERQDTTTCRVPQQHQWNHSAPVWPIETPVKLWQKRQVLHLAMERWGEMQCSFVWWLQAHPEVHRVYEANADGTLVNWIVSIVVENGWIQLSSNEQESRRKPPNLRPSLSMFNWKLEQVWRSQHLGGQNRFFCSGWCATQCHAAQLESRRTLTWFLHAVSRCVAGPPIDLKFQLCTWCSMLVYKSYILWEHSSVHNTLIRFEDTEYCQYCTLFFSLEDRFSIFQFW